MSEPVPNPQPAAPSRPRTRKWRRRLLIAGIGLVLLGAVFWKRSQAPLYDGKTLAEWLNVAVNSTNVDDRLHAIDKLVELAPQSVPYLVQRLQVKDSPVLVRYEQFWRGSPAPLRDRMPAPRMNHAEKVMAVYVLRQIGPAAASAVPELVRLLNSPMASDPLVEMPSRTPYEPLLPMRTPSPPRLQATNLATAFVASSRDAENRVPRQLNQRTAAVYALAAIGSDDPQVIAAMLAQSNRRDLGLQQAISYLIVAPRLHPALARAEPVLLSAFKSGSPFTRQTVLRACSVTISNSTALEAVVLAGASDPDWRLQAVALPLLGAIREQPAAAARAMVEALGSPAPMTFSPAIVPPIALPLPRVTPPPYSVEYPNKVALDLLTKTMPRHSFYYEALLQGLEHTNSLVRSGCLLAFRQAGQDAQPFAAEIEKLFLDDSRSVRQIAVTTSWQLTRWRGSMMSFMMSKLGDTNEFQRLSAVVFLESNPPSQKELEAPRPLEARRLLEERLRLDASSRIRARSATALAAMGGHDAKTMEALSTAGRDDEDLTVRQAAAEAMARLQGAPPGKGQ